MCIPVDYFIQERYGILFTGLSLIAFIYASLDGNLVVVRFATLHRAREAKDNMMPHGCGLHSD
jgi:hypothetical protein